ncbi:hypothetical protein [Candidatus Nitrospira neomarina]|uniref:Uncharacterized protein n=1 Tax=Candidatus Nitrospira neomarina TaxID=3020899 RepID=A0AA96GP42_9BACT|nr:hypothetical protein [Candidatus Nitrospira neomarina]WNM63785.1 hypothetical protein PQG83_08525 [Candidatus Nitrospira neomarina]
MPPFTWPTERSRIIAAFEKRHAAPEAGALLGWAVSAVDALYYLADIHASYDSSRSVLGTHNPDVIDVPHARWAAGTSMTALDLCAAALGRAICKHSKERELDLGSFEVDRLKEQALFRKLPKEAVQWLEGVLDDPGLTKLKDARHPLTHRRLSRHFSMSIGSSCLDERLKLQVGANRVRVADLVVEVRDLATTHVSALIQILPNL